MEVEHRPGGRTLRLSPLNAVFLDDHESWYAVHWTTELRPSNFADFASKDLSINDKTPTIVRTYKDTKSGEFWSCLPPLHQEDESNIEFIRVDAQDFVLIWEPSAQYARRQTDQPDTPYAAIMGFGSDAYDPDFGIDLLERTAAKQIAAESRAIWEELEFLAKYFKHRHIDPTKRYEDD